eukprot:c20166_g1_i1.p1 GENE.c20166_g1_i1~~c20166_g1_i1.p1  ORF type:complete len:580 (+),score=110.61 c20166_g1_i1:1742-3481(+)
MTGRRVRIVRSEAAGPLVYQARGDKDALDSVNVTERKAFMSGHKFVAVISDAASTGISLHAALNAPSSHRRRLHLTLELAWSADKAIQQLGRTHRTNQVSAPKYELVVTNLAGERRFAASVARRLASLGAITKGDRRAATGADMSEFNVDSKYGRKALQMMCASVAQQTLPDAIIRALRPTSTERPAATPALTQSVIITSDAAPTSSQPQADNPPPLALLQTLFTNVTQSLTDTPARDTPPVPPRPVLTTVQPNAATSALLTATTQALARIQLTATPGVNVRKLLNRMLVLNVAEQQAVFTLFQTFLDTLVAEEIANGTFDDGVTDVRATKVQLAHESLVTISNTDTVRISQLDLDRGVSWSLAQQRCAAAISTGADAGFYVSKFIEIGSKDHLVLLALPSAQGSVAIVRPNTGVSKSMTRGELLNKYTRVQPDQAETLWSSKYDGTLKPGRGCRLARINIVSGSILSLWRVMEVLAANYRDRVDPEEFALKISRCLIDGSGRKLVGMRVPGLVARDLESLLRLVSQIEVQPGAQMTSILLQRLVVWNVQGPMLPDHAFEPIKKCMLQKCGCSSESLFR